MAWSLVPCRSTALLLLSSIWVTVEAATEAGFLARLTKPVRLSVPYDALALATNPEAPLATEADSLIPARPSGSQGYLLIVEDNPVNQEVARGIAAKLGYRCDIAANGFEAVEALGRRSYDAVIMDCHMPEMEGFQATAEMRRRENGRSHVPMIAMTAGALVEDREKCLAAGMDDYLAKPVKEREMDAVLRRWVQADAASDTGAEPGETEQAPSDRFIDAARFDRLRALAASSGDPDFLVNLIDRYLLDSHAQLESLRIATAKGDAAEVKRLGHTMKGASATIGAAGLAATSLQVEQGASRGVIGPGQADWSHPPGRGVRRMPASSTRSPESWN